MDAPSLERMIEFEHGSLVILEQGSVNRVRRNKPVCSVKKDVVRVSEQVRKGVALEHDCVKTFDIRNPSILSLRLGNYDRAIVVFGHPAFFEPSGNSRIDIQPRGEVLMSQNLYCIVVAQFLVATPRFALIALDTLQYPRGLSHVSIMIVDIARPGSKNCLNGRLDVEKHTVVPNELSRLFKFRNPCCHTYPQ